MLARNCESPLAPETHIPISRTQNSSSSSCLPEDQDCQGEINQVCQQQICLENVVESDDIDPEPVPSTQNPNAIRQQAQQVGVQLQVHDNQIKSQTQRNLDVTATSQSQIQSQSLSHVAGPSQRLSILSNSSTHEQYTVVRPIQDDVGSPTFPIIGSTTDPKLSRQLRNSNDHGFLKDLLLSLGSRLRKSSFRNGLNSNSNGRSIGTSVQTISDSGQQQLSQYGSTQVQSQSCQSMSSSSNQNLSIDLGEYQDGIENANKGNTATVTNQNQRISRMSTQSRQSFHSRLSRLSLTSQTCQQQSSNQEIYSLDCYLSRLSTQLDPKYNSIHASTAELFSRSPLAKYLYDNFCVWFWFLIANFLLILTIIILDGLVYNAENPLAYGWSIKSDYDSNRPFETFNVWPRIQQQQTILQVSDPDSESDLKTQHEMTHFCEKIEHHKLVRTFWTSYSSLMFNCYGFLLMAQVYIEIKKRKQFFSKKERYPNSYIENIGNINRPDTVQEIGCLESGLQDCHTVVIESNTEQSQSQGITVDAEPQIVQRDNQQSNLNLIGQSQHLQHSESRQQMSMLDSGVMSCQAQVPQCQQVTQQSPSDQQQNRFVPYLIPVTDSPSTWQTILRFLLLRFIEICELFDALLEILFGVKIDREHQLVQGKSRRHSTQSIHNRNSKEDIRYDKKKRWFPNRVRYFIKSKLKFISTLLAATDVSEPSSGDQHCVDGDTDQVLIRNHLREFPLFSLIHAFGMHFAGWGAFFYHASCGHLGSKEHDIASVWCVLITPFTLLILRFFDVRDGTQTNGQDLSFANLFDLCQRNLNSTISKEIQNQKLPITIQSELAVCPADDMQCGEEPFDLKQDSSVEQNKCRHDNKSNNGQDLDSSDTENNIKRENENSECILSQDCLDHHNSVDPTSVSVITLDKTQSRAQSQKSQTRNTTQEQSSRFGQIKKLSIFCQVFQPSITIFDIISPRYGNLKSLRCIIKLVPILYITFFLINILCHYFVIWWNLNDDPEVRNLSKFGIQKFEAMKWILYFIMMHYIAFFGRLLILDLPKIKWQQFNRKIIDLIYLRLGIRQQFSNDRSTTENVEGECPTQNATKDAIDSNNVRNSANLKFVHQRLFHFCRMKYLFTPTLKIPCRLFIWTTIFAYIARILQWPNTLGATICREEDWWLSLHAWWHVLIATALYIEWFILWREDYKKVSDLDVKYVTNNGHSEK